MRGFPRSTRPGLHLRSRRRASSDCSEWLKGRCVASVGLRDRGQAVTHLVDPRPGDLLPDLAVLEEDERRPELHAEGASELPARSVLDLDVVDLGMVVEQAG